jgi:predicted TIM-barrel fold metal-dependent hydrolase
MRLESTVLYPTAALAIGLVQAPTGAASVARAYNNWFHARYIKKDSRLKGVAVLPVQDPEAAVDEIMRIMVKSGEFVNRKGVYPSAGRRQDPVHGDG